MEKFLLKKVKKQKYITQEELIKIIYKNNTLQLLDGTKFDSSVDRGTPFKFTLGIGQVIKCWDEGIAKLSIGEKAVLTCPPETAYGKRVKYFLEFIVISFRELVE